MFAKINLDGEDRWCVVFPHSPQKPLGGLTEDSFSRMSHFLGLFVAENVHKMSPWALCAAIDLREALDFDFGTGDVRKVIDTTIPRPANPERVPLDDLKTLYK